MKKITKVFIAITVVTSATFFIDDFSSPAHSNGSGAPVGRTGSPGDGANCAGCHAGSTVSTVTGVITSNVPVNGYIPGTTYTITATITGTGINKFGFQISPQTFTTGAQKGTLVVTDVAQTQLVGSGKYITHKAGGTSGSNTKTWTFNWIAPPSGSGPLKFFGAFVNANGNGQDSGDKVTLSSLSLVENTTGINEDALHANSWSVYPTPSTSSIQINNSLLNQGQFDISIYDVVGKKVKEIKKYNLIEKENIDISDLSNGIYVVSIPTEKGVVNKKIIKK